MAVTGGRITSSIYGTPQGDYKFGSAVTGRTMNFPNVGVLFYDAPPGLTAAGVTINGIIEVLPTGLNQPSKKYYSPNTAAQLLTNGS